MLEPVLSLVRERVRANIDPAWNRDALHACATWLAIHRPPNYENYAPGPLVKRALDGLLDDRRVLNLEPVDDCTGDVVQVGKCIRLLAAAAMLESDAILTFEVFPFEDKGPARLPDPVPCVALSFEGPGRFPKPLLIDAIFPIEMETLKERWTAATAGGRIDPAPNGLLLRMRGQRMAPEQSDALEPVPLHVEAAAAALASGNTAAALTALDAALAVLDGETRPPELADFARLFNDVREEYAPALEHDAVSLEAVFTTAPPPIPMRRARLRAFLSGLFNLIRLKAPGGYAMMLFDYVPTTRRFEAAITITGNESIHLPDAWFASFRRAVAEDNAGQFDAADAPRETNVNFSLPDPVGVTLDQWLPGWDVFSERSRQVLRLLKSGGAAPPAELLLPGMLEEELEQWLMPNLKTPSAVNIAHETPPPKHRPAASADRLKKALEQIRKGKPRRELAAPPFAAELLNLYRGDDRRRAAIGAERLSEEDVAQLVQWLTQTPIASIECLRTIARARLPRNG